MRFRTSTKKRLQIDVTPLIDVVFLLLIFFMISTTFIKPSQIRVDLPKAKGSSKPVEIKPLEVTINKKGQFFVNGMSTSKNKLRGILLLQQGKHKNASLIIRADGSVAHRLVVFTMDTAKDIGIHKIAIATQKAL